MTFNSLCHRYKNGISMFTKQTWEFKKFGSVLNLPHMSAYKKDFTFFCLENKSEIR